MAEQTNIKQKILAVASTIRAGLDAKADLVDGKVPSEQLPSYVDDVAEFPAKANFPETGETGKIYVDTSTGKTYRWSGTLYTEIASSEVSEVNGKKGNVTLTAADIPFDDQKNVQQVVELVGAAIPTASDTAPLMDGAASAGTGTAFARADHVHPSDESKADDSSVVHKTGAETVAGAKTFSSPLTVGTRTSNQPGDYAERGLTVGTFNAAGPNAFATGNTSRALGDSSIALGWRAVNTKDAKTTFTWQGDAPNSNNAYTRPDYTHANPGTFNINPVPQDGSDDPASGFYIGDESLARRLNEKADVQHVSNVEYAVLEHKNDSTIHVNDSDRTKWNAVTNKVGKSEVETGWWSEWELSGVVNQDWHVIVFNEGYSYNYYLNADDGTVDMINGDAEQWSRVEFNNGQTIATRHRIAGPVPTKPEDIGAVPYIEDVNGDKTAVALGERIIAGNASASGGNVYRTGPNSLTVGRTAASNSGELAVGEYNWSGAFQNRWDTMDRTLFSVGVGTSEEDRKNAFMVRSDGTVHVLGLNNPASLNGLSDYSYTGNIGLSGSGTRHADLATVINHITDTLPTLLHNTGDETFSGNKRMSGTTGNTSLTLGSRIEGSDLGHYTVAIGQDVVSSNTATVAIGMSAKATGEMAFTHGISNTASGNFAIALGSATTAAGHSSFTAGRKAVAAESGSGETTTNPHFAAFVWQGGVPNGFPTEYYHSHGNGTFNINPAPASGETDAASGFWIGETTLKQRLDAKEAVGKRNLLDWEYSTRLALDKAVYHIGASGGFIPTQDTVIDGNKTYYVYDAALNNYAYVDNPVVDDLGMYYEEVTLATLRELDTTAIPNANAYFCFELEVEIPEGATALDTSNWNGWTWIDGGELPDSDFAEKTLYIACRLDCQTRAITANCWRVA